MSTLDTIAGSNVDSSSALCEYGAWIVAGEVIERCLGNVELARRVVGRFRNRLSDACGELQVLASAGDLTTVASRAHRLKGEAANVGCSRISVLAADVEEFASQRLHDGLVLAVDLLVSTCREFEKQVSAQS